VRRYVSHAPAVRRLLEESVARTQKEQLRADLEQLERAPFRWRVFQLAVPVVCILGYLFWTGSGVHKQAIRELIMPVTMNAWLLILPYALMVPVLLMREHWRKRVLRRKVAIAPAEESPTQSLEVVGVQRRIDGGPS
jgi:hypothetical protein